VTPSEAPFKRRAPVVTPGSPQFEAVRALLAHHVGPIAKLLVQKAADSTGSVEEFCDQLAAHIKAAPEREAFLRPARRHLAAHS
jgi:serine/threonine-protein kinase